MNTTEADAQKTLLLKIAARKMMSSAGLDFIGTKEMDLLAQDLAEVMEEETLLVADAAKLLTRRIGAGNLEAYIACLKIGLPPRPKKVQP